MRQVEVEVKVEKTCLPDGQPERRTEADAFP